MFSQTKIYFTQSQLHRKMTKIHLSQIESSTFKILSYAGPSVLSSTCTFRQFCQILSTFPDLMHFTQYTLHASHDKYSCA